MTWKFIEWIDDQTFTLQIEFEDNRFVSIETEFDELQINFWDPNLFLSKNQRIPVNQGQITRPIPRMTDSSSLQSAVKGLTAFTFGAVVTSSSLSVISSYVMTASLNMLWALLNSL